MVGGAIVQVVLWIIVGATVIWSVGPSVAIVLGRRRIEIDVHPGELLGRPYPEDADGLRRYDQLVELGYRPIGATEEHVRFLTPLHWTWRSESVRWLVSPDDRTFTCLFRITPNEAIRVSAVTLFDGGGSWETTYPGVGFEREPLRNHGYAEVQSVEPAALLDLHAYHVERFRTERGLAVRSGALADVAAAANEYARALFAKRGVNAGLFVWPLASIAMPAYSSATALASGGDRARVGAAGLFIFSSLVYATVRLALLRSLEQKSRV